MIRKEYLSVEILYHNAGKCQAVPADSLAGGVSLAAAWASGRIAGEIFAAAVPQKVGVPPRISAPHGTAENDGFAWFR